MKGEKILELDLCSSDELLLPELSKEDVEGLGSVYQVWYSVKGR